MQRAKAINFGIPGGQGARGLQTYALSSYGVRLSLAQARLFRMKMIKEVYPEIGMYLYQVGFDFLSPRPFCVLFLVCLAPGVLVRRHPFQCCCPPASGLGAITGWRRSTPLFRYILL